MKLMHMANKTVYFIYMYAICTVYTSIDTIIYVGRVYPAAEECIISHFIAERQG